MYRLHSNASIWIFAFSLAIGLFLTRGFYRQIHDSGDCAIPFLSSAAWRSGLNPYDHQVLESLWKQKGDGGPAPKQNITPAVYPPTLLPLLAYFTFLNWQQTRIILTIIFSVLAGVILIGLCRLNKLPLTSTSGKLFCLTGIAFAPIHTGMSKSNLVIPTVALLVTALLATQTNLIIPAGIAAGVACGLKPQIGIVLLLYWMVTRQWRLCFIAAGTVAFLGVIAILPMQITNPDWVQHWAANGTIFQQSQINSTDVGNPYRYHMIHIDVLTGPHKLIWASLLIGYGGVLTYIIAATPISRQSLLSFLLLFNLVFTYHRFYDATLLLIPFSFALAKAWRENSWLILLPGCAFLFPSAVFLKGVADSRGWLDSWIWQGFILPHQVWALLGLLTLLLIINSSRNGLSNRDDCLA